VDAGQHFADDPANGGHEGLVVVDPVRL
jgi:hypothetical protein